MNPSLKRIIREQGCHLTPDARYGTPTNLRMRCYVVRLLPRAWRRILCIQQPLGICAGCPGQRSKSIAWLRLFANGILGAASALLAGPKPVPQRPASSSGADHRPWSRLDKWSPGPTAVAHSYRG